MTDTTPQPDGDPTLPGDDDTDDQELVGEPEDTDNSPRPEDGDQDVDQSPDPAS